MFLKEELRSFRVDIALQRQRFLPSFGGAEVRSRGSPSPMPQTLNRGALLNACTYLVSAALILVGKKALRTSSHRGRRLRSLRSRWLWLQLQGVQSILQGAWSSPLTEADISEKYLRQSNAVKLNSYARCCVFSLLFAFSRHLESRRGISFMTVSVLVIY